jgi:cysteine desulfurase
MRVYMDNNATTPLHPGVAAEMTASLDLFGNPSSMHSFGRETRVRVEEARERVAEFLEADTSSVIFTGGGSESNNTVLKLVTCSDATCVHCPANRKQIITTTVEHPSVLNTVEKLESRGAPAKYIGVDVEGKIDLNRLEEEVSDQTALVSVMMANNEIGTVQNIREVSKIAHRHGALIHTDAVQAVGKLPLSIRDLDIDFLSFSAHKLYGPKGVGVLCQGRGSFLHFYPRRSPGRRATGGNAEYPWYNWLGKSSRTCF